MPWMKGDQLWLTGWPNSTNRPGPVCTDTVSALAQPGGRAAGVIGQDAVRARALDAAEALEDGLAFVDPAVAGCRREHRVFAADLINECRHAECVLHAAHDIEIRQSRLDHHDIRAF